MENIEYWVVGGSLMLFAVSFFMVMTPIYALRFMGEGKMPPLAQGRVSIMGLRLYDVLGVGFFFGVYGLLGFTALGAEAPETPHEEMSTSMLMVASLVQQGLFIFVVVGVLCWRVNLVEFFGIAPRCWYLVPVAGVAVVVVMLALAGVLAELKYDEWIAGLQGLGDPEDAQQEVVKMMQENQDTSIFVLMAIVACIGAPLSEELIFRGYLYPVVKRFSNLPIAMFLSGLLFAAVHTNLAAMLPLFVIGVLLAAVYEWTGSIWAPILGHAMFNSLSVLGTWITNFHPEWLEEAEKAKEAGWIFFLG